MIYIKENETQIIIPKHNTQSAPLKLIAKNPLKQIVMAENVVDLSVNHFFYIFNIETQDLSVGEWEYFLYDANDEIIEKGLFTFGEYIRPQIITPETTTKENIQFQKR